MSAGPKPVPDNSEAPSPYQYHIDFLRDIANFAKSNNTQELEQPSIIGTLIFIRTTVREKEAGAEEFAPHYEATKQAIQEHLGIDYTAIVDRKD